MTISRRVLTCFSIVMLSSACAVCQWTQQPFSSTEVLSTVRFVDSTTGWILGEKFVYKTSNAGNSWIPQDSSHGTGVVLTALNRDTLFYASYNNAAPYTRGLRRTTDGGLTWSTVDTLQLLWTRVKFVDNTIGYASGGIGVFPNSHPIVRKTTDGGASWFTTWTGTGNQIIQGMHFFGATHGWIVTYDGAFLESTDAGVSWNVEDSLHFPLFLPVRDLTFASPDSGWAVGGISGTSLVVRTTDAGVHWSTQTFPGSSLREVTFLNTQMGWFAGSVNFPPYIARSNDGGTTWTTQNLAYLTFGAESISMVDTSLGWAVNNKGVVFKTTNGGVTSIAPNVEELPGRLTLDQNFPNPFNPSTTIRYGLPNRSHVTLTVFNTLGQEVAVLQNGEQDAGYHEVRFDGKNLGSSVYFYRIQAGSFREAKKLMLVR